MPTVLSAMNLLMRQFADIGKHGQNFDICKGTCEA
jgi:hypothetical protein